MSTQELIALALTLLQAIAGKNVVVQDIEVIVPQIETALASAASGGAASVAFPLSVYGKPFTASFNLSPTTVTSA